MAILGYGRVSINGQDLAGQVAELQVAGYSKIYREKVSGVKTIKSRCHGEPKIPPRVAVLATVILPALPGASTGRRSACRCR
jgi:hypothetical protein